MHRVKREKNSSREQWNRVLTLPNRARGLASGISEAICLLPVPAVILFGKAFGCPVKLELIICVAICCSFLGSILFFKWVNLASKRIRG